MLQKTDDGNFMKDTASNGVINTNATAYKLYKQQRDQSIANRNLQQEVTELKSDISDIKQLLGQLIQNVGINR